MPTVNDTPIPSAKEFSQALLDAYAGEPTVADPVRLFATACITSVATGGGSESIAAAAAGKRNPDSRAARAARRAAAPPDDDGIIDERGDCRWQM